MKKIVINSSSFVLVASTKNDSVFLGYKDGKYCWLNYPYDSSIVRFASVEDAEKMMKNEEFLMIYKFLDTWFADMNEINLDVVKIVAESVKTLNVPII